MHARTAPDGVRARARADLSASDPSPSFIANKDGRGDGGACVAPVRDGALGAAVRNDARGSDGSASSDGGADDPTLDDLRPEAAAASSDGKETAQKEPKQTHKQTNTHTNKHTHKASVGGHRWTARSTRAVRAARVVFGPTRMADREEKARKG